MELAAWAADARLFTLIHRQALEAAHVTEHLPHWIDLVFGYKQTGQPALDAINVFPACVSHALSYLLFLAPFLLPHDKNNSCIMNIQIFVPWGDRTRNITHHFANRVFRLYKLLIQTSINIRLKDPFFSSNGLVLYNSVSPQTYYGFDPSALEEEVDRTAAAAMVRTYGQAPRQLLRAPHPHAAHDLTQHATDQVLQPTKHFNL